eukprot:1175538-Rhodomonas_salina.3
MGCAELAIVEEACNEAGAARSVIANHWAEVRRPRVWWWSRSAWFWSQFAWFWSRSAPCWSRRWCSWTVYCAVSCGVGADGVCERRSREKSEWLCGGVWGSAGRVWGDCAGEGGAGGVQGGEGRLQAAVPGLDDVAREATARSRRMQGDTGVCDARPLWKLIRCVRVRGQDQGEACEDRHDNLRRQGRGVRLTLRTALI